MSITLYLIGKPGSGKYTIAKEIAKFGYVICDNQLINNPIFSLINCNGFTDIEEKAWCAIRQIRKNIFDYIAKDLSRNYVFTNYLVENDHKLFNQVKELANRRKSVFIPVKLSISEEENIKRIKELERLIRYKTIDPKFALSESKLINIDHINLLNLDITNISAVESAKLILDHVETIYDNVDRENSDGLFLDESGNGEIDRIILKNLKAFNESKVGEYSNNPFTVYFKKRSKIIAGAKADIIGNLCKIDLLWVDKKFRNLKIGSNILQKIDEYAKSKNCRIIQLDTAEFQAKDFYIKNGFIVAASIDEAFLGHMQYIMIKRI